MYIFLTSDIVPVSAYEKIKQITEKETPIVGIIDIATKSYFEKESKDADWVTKQFSQLEKLGFSIRR